MRIVSLLPSATEIVGALGAQADLVGISHSCDYPRSVVELPRVTSTRVPYQKSSIVIDDFVREHLENNAALYDLDTLALETLRPDVLVSQALCDVCAVATGDVLEAIGALTKVPKLVDLNPNTLDDVLHDIGNVASSIGRESEGRKLLAELARRRSEVNRVSAAISLENRPRVAFVEWLIPPFNGGHWNPELVEEAGGLDILGSPGEPSRTLTVAEIKASKPDVLFFAACGFDVDRTVVDIQLLGQSEDWRELLEACAVFVADGDSFFARPGPRLIDGLEILAHAMHPAKFAEPAQPALRITMPLG